MTITFKFEPRDLWIGVFWDRTDATIYDDWAQRDVVIGRALHIYVCLVPTLVIHIVRWPVPTSRRAA